MTKIDDNTWATDFKDEIANNRLTEQGFSIRHIETWERDGPRTASSSGTARRSPRSASPY